MGQQNHAPCDNVDCISRCIDCGHDVDSHDVRGWDAESKCSRDCEVCFAADIADRTYAQAVADIIAQAFRQASIAGVRVA